MNNDITRSLQPEDNRKSANDAIHIFAELSDCMPPIGFLNRNKRLNAYITVSQKAQLKIEAEQINTDEALFVLSLLARKNKDFQKAAMIAALSLAKLDPKLLSPIGVQFANEIRANMKLSPVTNNLLI